jgi:hypothetical protein
VKNLVLILVLFVSSISYSADSTRIDTSYHHNRNHAVLWSTFIPGAGQVYNEIGHRKVQGKAHISWWRAPIYIAGMSVAGYFAITNGREAKALKTEWIYRDENNLESNYIGFTKDELLTGTATSLYGFNDRAKFRDYAVAGFVVVYGMNLIDAFVDAHFVTFDVSQQLQFSMRPKLFSTNEYGVSLALKFK